MGKAIIKKMHSEKNLLKNSLNNNNKKIDNNFKDKITYIINFLLNSEYYMKYINLNNSNILNSKSSDDKETNQGSSENPEKEKLIGEGSKNDQNQESTLRDNSSLSDDNTFKKIINGEGRQSINQSQSNMDSISLNNLKKEMKNEFIKNVEYVLWESTINLIINNKEFLNMIK